jgi:hypothetical protein
MTGPAPYESAPYENTATDDPGRSPLIRTAIWVAIGALILAAIVCVVWVLIGPENGIIARAFLTVLLLAAFAGVAILDAHLAPRRPAWFALASMATWVVILLIGAVMIWMPERFPYSGFGRFVSFLLIVLILQLALLHVRLFTRALARNRTTFTQVIAIVTIVLVVALAIMLVIPLMLAEWSDFDDLYWRFVVAITILAAVGTALLPLINVLFAPKRPRPAPVAAGWAPSQPGPGWAPQGAGYPSVPPGAFPSAPTHPAPTHPAPPHPVPAPAAPAPCPQAPVGNGAPPHEPLPWPMFADGRTPLPMLPDGNPDFQAYYTGRPSPGAQSFVPVDQALGHTSASAPATAPADPAPPAAAPAHPAPDTSSPGYEGFPPPPPLPPRP